MKYIDATVIHLIYRFISLYLHINFNFMIYIFTPMQEKNEENVSFKGGT